jgi:hypothetical protein
VWRKNFRVEKKGRKVELNVNKTNWKKFRDKGKKSG